MADFVTLSCPNCGGKLEITNDIDRFACGHCGKEQVVRRSGGIVSLAPVVQGLKHVQAGVDKTASELAIQRLSKDLAQFEQQLKTPYAYISNAQRRKESKRPQQWFDSIVDYTLGWGAIIAIGSLVALIAGYQQSIVVVILFVSGLVAAISFFFRRSVNDSYANRVGEQSDREISDREQEVKVIQKKIDEKRQEIAKHQKIIEQ